MWSKAEETIPTQNLPMTERNCEMDARRDLGRIRTMPVPSGSVAYGLVPCLMHVNLQGTMLRHTSCFVGFDSSNVSLHSDILFFSYLQVFESHLAVM